ncbi:hypothetical protein CAPTEDRAFT_92351 [Capitella teleta]|uniref:Uncharacterized protein n=1 Tax=Capitella teleta TaxID=283909 RepID=R7V9L3_CAPTE|nr:hypothetical protein CAPTEDRAFT_94358 [Capitella teleta]ELU15264.1 hypothetical protein CAPTEDRAFT_92351 [Capitella teleta]|eukprot:ELU01164.1 hypothetical protein CAPTEDRAFT_94358 [Capitella teleta]
MDDVGSHKALHDQVNRLHMRSLIDSDKREIRLLQEMYLPDGDMHSEGQGRMRRFRWANIDDDGTQQDMFRDSDGEEKEEEEEEAESKWRMERIEREKFLAEQKVIVLFLNNFLVILSFN